jgi:hypothetical protein
MLRNWLVTNQEPFTTEKLQEIWKLYDRGLLKRPRSLWKNAGGEVRTLVSFYFWLILAAAAFILPLPARNRGLVVIVWGCVVIVASCIALALYTKPVPYRASLPLVLGCIALSILSSLPLLGDALGRRLILPTRRPKILGLIVAIILLVPVWSNTVSHELEAGQIAAVITEDLQAHQPANPHTLYVWWGFYNELAYLSPPFRESSRPTNMVGAGWFLYSPPSQDKLARNGISRLDEDACKRSDIVFIAPRAMLDVLADYYAERYRKSISVEPVFTGQTLRFYRCWISKD